MKSLWISRDKGKMWDKEVWFWKKKPDFEHGIFYLEDDTYQENSLDEFPYKYFQRIFGDLEPGECKQVTIEYKEIGVLK